jgi:hypothetical protein
MVWQVIWSLLAGADLDGIKAYLDANHGPRFAKPSWKIPDLLPRSGSNWSN